MACFTATIVDAIATTVITAVVKKKEKAQEAAVDKNNPAEHHTAVLRIKLSLFPVCS